MPSEDVEIGIQEERNERILLLTPSGRDGEIISQVLVRSGLRAEVCRTLGELCAGVVEGAGAVVIADEALNPQNVNELSRTLQEQPPWSDLPVLIMTGGGEATVGSERRLRLLERIGNITLIERPLRTATFISSIQTVLRARQHQYALRAYLQEQAAQRQVLEMIANRSPLSSTLDVICRLIEEQVPGSVCGILLRDFAENTLNIGAMPALPEFASIVGAIPVGPNHGPCASACYHREPVIVADVETNPLAEPVRGVLLRFGLRASWSKPIVSGGGEVLGVFTLYHRTSPRFPDVDELKRRDCFLQLAALAIERQRSEDSLRESEARYRMLAEALPQLVWTCLPNGRCDYLSTQWTAYTGLPEAEQIGRGWLQVLHPDDHQRAFAAWMAAVDGIAEYDVEYRLRRYDGCYRWFKTRATAIRDSSGNIVKWFGTCTDIEDQRRTLAALQESERRFRSMADSAPVLIWTSGLDKGLDWVNKAWLQFTGRAMEQETGEGWKAVLHPDDAPQCIAAYEEAFDRRSAVSIEYRMRQRDGAYRWILGNGVPRFTPAGEFAGYIGSCIDITEIKEAEHALQRSNQALRRANEDLEQFAFSASHDLQEPLRNIAIFSQLMKRRYSGNLDAEADQFISYMVEGAQRMSMLVRDLLSYIGVTATTGASARPPVNAEEMLAAVLRNLHASIQESGGTVTSTALPSLRIEPVHLQQVLQNLVGNAIKYRGEAAPRVHVSAERTGDEWLFSVKDNGIGIDPQYAKQVFGLFKRLHRREEYSGTGIGLAICQKIVERYGGRIWVTSEPGKGSTFYFTFPVQD